MNSSASMSSTEATVVVPITPSVPVTPKQSSAAIPNKAVPFSLESAAPLSIRAFPNPPSGDSLRPIATIPNLQHMLEGYGIAVRYDVIKKKVRIEIPGQQSKSDNTDNVGFNTIISLANLNGMPTQTLQGFIGVVADKNAYNPVADWISSKPWDGVDRLPEFFATLQEREGFPVELKEILMYRWMLSAVAAVLKTGFRTRGVLTLQGPQSLGKTAWVSALVPDPMLRDAVVKLDHHLDPGNKDSLLTAISHWIVEVGELDSSFKKDVARLKGFLTSTHDKVRKPYDRCDTESARRTVFCATVNDESFLVDSTGNTRWLTIPIVSINYQHTIDMQQLYAQLAGDIDKGERWWLNQEEESQLEAQNADHRSVSVIRELLLGIIDVEQVEKMNCEAMTATEVLDRVGIHSPTNAQCKECGALLREIVGTPKKIRGQMKWRVPLLGESYSRASHFISMPTTVDDQF